MGAVSHGWVLRLQAAQISEVVGRLGDGACGGRCKDGEGQG